MNNPFDLTGKKIILVGISSITGQIVYKQLKSFGAEVAVMDNNSEDIVRLLSQIEFLDIQSYLFPMYVIGEIESVIKKAVNENGPFDGFVFCAGIGGVRPLSMTKNAFFNNMLNSNVSTFVEMIRCISKKNSFNNGGSIVALSSVSSIKGLKSKLAYSASKAALEASVRSMAAELSERKIRVNSIQKGWVEADMNQGFILDNMALSENDDFKRQLLGVISSEDIANSIVFLLSDASKSITGTTLLVDGGYTL